MPSTPRTTPGQHGARCRAAAGSRSRRVPRRRRRRARRQRPARSRERPVHDRAPGARGLLARRRPRDRDRLPRRLLPAPGALAAAGPGRRRAARGRGRDHRRPTSTTRSAPGTILLEGPFAAGFTMVWIVGMINSINFIDGLDGLSSGIALIAAVTLGPDLADHGHDLASRSSRCCASRWRGRCSGSCAGTSTRRRSSSAPAA